MSSWVHGHETRLHFPPAPMGMVTGLHFPASPEDGCTRSDQPMGSKRLWPFQESSIKIAGGAICPFPFPLGPILHPAAGLEVEGVNTLVALGELRSLGPCTLGRRLAT